MARSNFARVICVATLVLGAGAATAAPKGGSGPSQGQIDCENRAVNDYWANVASCEKVLSDLPADLKQCKDDAAADLHRSKAACSSAAMRNEPLSSRVKSRLPSASR